METTRTTTTTITRETADPRVIVRTDEGSTFLVTEMRLTTGHDAEGPVVSAEIVGLPVKRDGSPRAMSAHVYEGLIYGSFTVIDVQVGR